jgi:hypothetical protein
MGAITWLDRITDESNPWLTATKAEEAGDYPGAAAQYLRDAVSCLDRKSQVRAALSCYCAADCLSKLGMLADARRLFFEAGKLYAEIADQEVSGSIREALWALQRAYGCYVLADKVKESEAAYESFRLLARRANPFTAGSEWLEMPKVSPHQFLTAPGSPSAKETVEIKQAIGKFLALRGSSRRETLSDRKPRRPVEDLDDQEGFVSQLG